MLTKRLLFFVFYFFVFTQSESFASSYNQHLAVGAGVTAINETPADSRLSYTLFYKVDMPWNLSANLQYINSNETQTDLPRVTIMKFHLNTLLFGLNYKLPALKSYLLNIGARAGVSRVQYVYETDLAPSEMLTPELQIGNVAQISNSTVWGPSLGFEYKLSNRVSVGFDTLVLFFPANGALSSFSTIDMLGSFILHF